MRRVAHALEHLDGASLEPGVLEGNLRDLRRINRAFGGTALSIRALRELTAREAPSAGRSELGPDLRVLDVGTGAADIPLAMAAASGPWQSVHVTATDSRAEVLDAARRINAGLERRADISLALADGRALPFGDDDFDVAHASLVLHHLEPDEAILFLGELARVARLGVIVNDLAPGSIYWLGAWLLVHLTTRNRFTCHDGPLSVRRAYTRAEVGDLLRAAGLEAVAESRAFAGHRWAIAAVRR